uniref:C-type lectin domain-containing protein n=1 Tax=Acrobeloides nanus TaxID=290746 RepID=A0A914E9E1_9BILA
MAGSNQLDMVRLWQFLIREPKTDNNLATYMKTQTSLWYTSSIVTNYNSICEVFLSSFSCPGSTTTIPIDPTEIFPTQGECPDGFSYFEKTNSCYYVLYYGDGLRWDDAENYCLNHSAKLASIHSLHETNFILSITGTTNSDNEWAWIGLYRQNIQSPWTWIDGTAVDLTNWDTTVNPPTNNSDFLYAAINTYGGAGESELGKWTDAPIESIGVARAICKTPAFGLK